MAYCMLVRRATVLGVIVFPAWPSLAVTRAQEATAPSPHHATLADFLWLAGHWEGNLGPMTAEQAWMAPKNGTMQGFFRLTDAEKTMVIELFTLPETPEGVAMHFPHFFQGLKTWEV